VQQILQLFACFPAARTWSAEDCQAGRPPPIYWEEQYALDGFWWRSVDAEVCGELDGLAKGRP